MVQKALAIRVFPLLSDDSLYTYLPTEPPQIDKLEGQYLFWEQCMSPDKTEYWLNWVVFEKKTQEIVGTLQAGIHIESQVATIAYLIGRAFQGKGYGTEGVTSMIEHLKSNYEVSHIKAWIDTRNVPSLRLVEKVGMKRVEFIEKADHFKGSDSDEYVYALDIVKD